MKRDLALYTATKCGGRVKAFTQPTGECAAHAAIWIRRRARRKEFFDTAKGFSNETQSLLGLVSVTKYILEKETRHAAKAGSLMTSQEKSIQKYNAAPKHEAIRAQLVILNALGDDNVDVVFDRIELQMQLGTPEPDREKWLARYLRKKELQETKELPRLDGKLESGAGIVTLADETPGKFCFIGMGGTLGRIGHAVALDRWSQPGRTAYFDPNMGEVDFSDDEFAVWMGVTWPQCFTSYDKHQKFVARIFVPFEGQS